MKVKEILRKKSPSVITVGTEETLQAACQLLVEHNIGALVVTNSSGLPIGILSERDIVHQVAEYGASAVSRKVRDGMTKDITIALCDDEIAYLSNTMTNKRIRHLPVMDDQKLVGIVSIGDVVKAQLDYFEGEAHSLRRYITGGYT
jgi:CBS domain-containing protein